MGDPLREVAAAYEGLERPESFADESAVDSYRAELLSRSAEQAQFLRPQLPVDAVAVEAACGNGRLLVALALEGALRHGTGFDVASSRIGFARQWAQDLGLDGRLTFAVADAVTVELAWQEADLAVLITGALGYFGAATPELPAQVLTRLGDALRPGGLLALELYPHPVERRLLEQAGGELRTWRELPAEDPWRFYLSHLVLRDDVLVHDKTFVHRDTGVVDAGRREHLLLYRPDDLLPLLDGAGFEQVSLHEGWSPEPYAGGETLVVTARTPQRRRS